MTSTPSLSALISRWRDLREQGRSMSADDLGSDCPELSDPTRRLEAVAFMEDFLGLMRDSAASFLPKNAAPSTRQGNHAPSPPTVGPEPVRAAPVRSGSLESPHAPAGPEGYEMLGELSRGAMGIVYKARQKGLNRLVALKMIRGLALPDARQRERFRREAESVARLRHPNVVQVYEIGEYHDRPFFAMEYVEDGSLDRVTGGMPQPIRETTRLVATIADAVQHAHEAGIIHRDLKPGNVLLRRKSDRSNPKSQIPNPNPERGGASELGFGIWDFE